MKKFFDIGLPLFVLLFAPFWAIELYKSGMTWTSDPIGAAIVFIGAMIVFVALISGSIFLLWKSYKNR